MFLTRWLPVPNFALWARDDLAGRANLRVLTEHTATGFAGTGSRVDALTGRRRCRDRARHRGFDVRARRRNDRDGPPPRARGRVVALAGSVAWQPSGRDTVPGSPRRADRVGSAHGLEPVLQDVQQPPRRAAQVPTQVPARPRARESSEALNVHGMFAFESSISENLVYLKQFVKAAVYGRRVGGLRSLAANVRASGKYLLPLMWTYAKDHRIFEPSTSKISLFVQMEQVPRDDSTIRIDPSRRDRTGLPQVLLDWRVDGARGRGAPRLRAPYRPRAAARRASPGWRSTRTCSRRSGFLSRLRDTNHQAGGAIMASSSSAGVVDSDLRVFGTDNLYVAGASTFPAIGAGNTTFPALALASRLVEHLGSRDGLDDHFGIGKPTTNVGFGCGASSAVTGSGIPRASSRPRSSSGSGTSTSPPATAWERPRRCWAGPRRRPRRDRLHEGRDRAARILATPLRRAEVRQADASAKSTEGSRTARRRPEHQPLTTRASSSPRRRSAPRSPRASSACGATRSMSSCSTSPGRLDLGENLAGALDALVAEGPSVPTASASTRLTIGGRRSARSGNRAGRARG